MININRSHWIRCNIMEHQVLTSYPIPNQWVNRSLLPVFALILTNLTGAHFPCDVHKVCLVVILIYKKSVDISSEVWVQNQSPKRVHFTGSSYWWCIVKIAIINTKELHPLFTTLKPQHHTNGKFHILVLNKHRRRSTSQWSNVSFSGAESLQSNW